MVTIQAWFLHTVFTAYPHTAISHSTTSNDDMMSLTNLFLKFRFERLRLSICLLLLLPFPAYAVEQSGEKDRSGIRVSLSILPSIQIIARENVQLDISDRSVDASFSEPFCVRGNASAKYQIVAYGSINNQKQFTLSNAQGETLAYTVSFRGNPLAGTFNQLSPGAISPVYHSVAQEADCKEGAVFKINFKAVDLQSASSGLFSGALTLLVTPV